jgi:hypothetical protein
MKKNIKYILLFLTTSIVFASCKNDLIIQPTTILGTNQVFTNENAIIAYLATLYSNLPIEDFNFTVGGFNNSFGGANRTCNYSGEALQCYSDINGDLGSGTTWGWWSGGYSTIRDVNNFIANIPSANLTPDKKLLYLGEAMFIRGYDYFGLVKRYGGVPLVKNVQTYTGNITPLQVPRNTEQEVYDYIGTQLDSAAMLLPATSQSGRANKYVALALKSRVMLYAATEAKYGNVQLNGLVGIPASAATAYFKAAFNAADSVMQSGLYALYNKYPDKVANFTNLFLDDDPSSNREIILERNYIYPQKTHSYDLWELPFGVRGPWGYGSRMDPTLEMVEQFENVDGTPGTLQVTDINGNPIEYTNPLDIFKNKDPRLAATMILPFSTWEGTPIPVQAGIIDDAAVSPNTTVYGRKTVTAGNYNQLYDINTHQIDANGTLQVVAINGIQGNETSPTGFYIRKYLNFNMPQGQAYGNNSTQSYFDIRYAEVLLNYAEAAIELGDVADAESAVNQIRDRAGIAELTDAEVTRDAVRQERTVELAFESQHYWDIRRWHIADQLIINKKFTALYPYYDLQNHAYVFTKVPVGNQYTFLPELYYEKIDPGQISADPKLIQNPLY